MPRRLLQPLALLLTILSAAALAQTTTSIIQRDVCIIGGGSSGTHAAVQLHLKGKSVALVERDPQLGGHVDTYKDPATGKTTDYGVVVFNNVSAVRDYFKHWNIPLVPLSSSGGGGGGGVSRSANFRTGQEVTNPAPIAGAAVNEALKRYRVQLAKYPGIKQEWNIPDPVPADLLLPFGDFLHKYKLEALAPVAYAYNQGAGDVLAQPALYLLKYLEEQQVESTLTGFLANGLGNNQLIYDKAKAELGRQNVFVNSYPSFVERYPDHVDVHIVTPGGLQLIRAKKLLVSIQPSTDSLKFLDLDSNERSLFGQFNNSYYYDAVIRNTGIPDKISLSNRDPSAPLQVPGMPGTYGISSNGIAGLHNAYYGSSHYMTNEDVQKQMLIEIDRVRKGLGYPAPQGKPEFVGFNAHVPFVATVSTDEIKRGFYRKLQALQGKKNTFYTGAAWNVQASSNLWGFNEQIIVPKIMKALGA